MQCSSIGIIGLGLIGGSIGKGLLKNEASHNVLGWDVNEDAIDVALASGAVTHACEPEKMAGKAELLILAVPPSQMKLLSEKVAPFAGKGLKAVTDTASTKSAIVKQLSAIWKEKYVGLHPMAGKEKAGIDNSSADLFEGAAWAVVPSAISSKEAVEMATDLVCALHSIPITLTPEEHDAIVAVTSHLPMFLATALVTLAAQRASRNPKLSKFVAGGFRDTTRVASCQPWLISEVWETNEGFIKEALKDFINILSEMSSKDSKSLAEMATEAKRARESLLAGRGEGK